MTLAPSWAAFHKAVRRESDAGLLPRQSGMQAYPRGHVWVVEEFRVGEWRPLAPWPVWFVTRREAGEPWTPTGVWSGSTYRTRVEAQAFLNGERKRYGRELLNFDPKTRRFVQACRVRSWGRAG